MNVVGRANKDVNIIFLMGLFPPQIREDIELNSKCGIQYAADALQWSIVKGFAPIPSVKIINLPHIGSFPMRFKKLKSYAFNFQHKEGANDVNVGFLNLPIIKMLSRYRNAKKELFKALSIASGETVIIVYSAHSPFLRAAAAAARRFAGTRICLIVPDMPEHVADGQNVLYRLLKCVDCFVISKALKDVDSFALLTETMADALGVGCRPYVMVEGIYNPSDSPENVAKEKYKTILYTGTLARRYGIMNLLNAFSAIDKTDYRLWICGEGDCRKEVESLSKTDKRVTYYGQISRCEVLMLQKKATVLVNPRTSEGDFTKYSFPSKIMEYLASGTPCIIHHLGGIPDEYFQYCFVCDEESAEGLKSALLTVCGREQSELDRFGDNAARFIKEQKNPVVQVKKIIDMLKI